MVIKVGINGFGRVGRIVFRTCFERPDLEVTAINDPAVDIDYICYLLKYDSTHGKFVGNVTHTEDEIQIDECRRIKVFNQRMPTAVPWNSAEVQYVVEASGMFTEKERASGHLQSSGVKRIIVTAPSVDVPIIILGVNDNELTIDQKIVSCGSSTLYCLAPIMKVLEDKYGVEEGFVTSIHAMTPSLKPLDGLCLRGKHWRDHRSILQNIVPAVTGACKALGRIIPSMKDKMCGLAFRVPIVNVSVLDLTVRLKEPTSIARIVEDINEINKTTRHTIIKSVNEENVSSDFMKDTYSCILDVKSSQQLKPNSLKLICWYENEYSYACRVADLICFSESQAGQCDYKTRATFVRTRYSKLLDVIAAIPETSMINKNSKIACNITSSKTQKSVSPRKRSPPLPIKPLGNDKAKDIDLLKASSDDNDNRISDGNKSSLFYTSNSIFQTSVPIKEAHERLQKFKKQYREMVHVTDELLKKKIIAKTTKNNEDDVNKNNTHDNTILEKNSSLSCNSSSYDIRCKKINDIVSNEHNSKRMLRRSVSITSFDIINQSTEKSDSIQNDSGIRSLTNSDVIKEKLDSIDNISMATKIPSPEIKSIENHVAANHCPGKMATDKDKKIIDRKMSMHFLKHCTKETQVTTSSYSVIVQDRETDSHINECLSIDNKPASDNEQSINEVSDVDVRAIYKTTHDPVDSDKNLTDIQNSSKKTIVSNSLADEPKRPPKIAQGSCSLVNHVLSSSLSPFYNNAQNKRNQDIFDKLDSTSESHSDDSFDVNGKKSQILKITDLTNSLQDLDRLDKICRIIEISDELSDKLFSELDKEPNCRNKNTGKKWSFKNLCEKINFDEFCNKVFVKK